MPVLIAPTLPRAALSYHPVAGGRAEAMEVHASCGARDGAGVLLLGRSGAGKSDLLLRLIDDGFALVADDRVVIEAGMARARPGFEGLLEVRGVGVIRLPWVAQVPVRLVVRLSDQAGLRLPEPVRLDWLDAPVIDLNPDTISAALRTRVAMDSVLGRLELLVGFNVF